MRLLHDALIKSIEQLGRKDDTARLIGVIEKMATGLLPAAKDAVHPIGTTCETIKFGNGTAYYTEVNQEDKDVIMGKEFEVTEEKEYRVLISELDMKKGTCKVSLRDDLTIRYNARITDPQIELADNKYAMAMSHKSIVIVRAKQKIHKGRVLEFVISDIE